MIEKLKGILKNSYSPYSNYPVSAICVTKDSKEFIGVNVENASYGATICAERNAINSAIANGYKRNDFKELHVMVNSDKIGFPCFICRQVITEFFEENAIIHLYSNNDHKSFSVKELCPHPFNEDNL